MKDTSEIIKGFFNGVCDVFEYTSYKDGDGIIQHEEKKTFSDIPCRLCYKSIRAAMKGKASDYITQDAVLLTGTDADIKNGSLIKVRQNGKTAVYQKTGEAAVYPNHIEIKMTLKNDFA